MAGSCNLATDYRQPFNYTVWLQLCRFYTEAKYGILIEPVTFEEIVNLEIIVHVCFKMSTKTASLFPQYKYKCINVSFCSEAVIFKNVWNGFQKDL